MPNKESYQKILEKLSKKKTWRDIFSTVRDHFLTLTYDLGNTALYFNSSLLVLSKINLLDDEIDEGHPLFYVFLTAAAILFAATYRSYLRSTHEYFTQEVTSCTKDCGFSKILKTTGGLVGSLFKSFASCGSVYDLAMREIGGSIPTYIVVALISLGNFTANLSILNRSDPAPQTPNTNHNEESDEYEEIDERDRLLINTSPTLVSRRTLAYGTS